MHCSDREDEFSKKLDALDAQIAELVKERIELYRQMPDSYDCDGEGEVYFEKLPEEYDERVYHAVAGI